MRFRTSPLEGMSFVDLFCGVGGFAYGARAAGLGECVWACDTDRRARENYRLNHGDHEPARDIRDADPRDISPFQVLFGGFPCQPFSVSAARKGPAATGLNDPRGNLFREIVRLAEPHRPQVMVLENVPRLMTMDGGRVWETISGELRRIGYRVYASVLNASRYGIPQARKRLYIVGLRDDCLLTYFEPQPEDTPCRLADIMEPEDSIPAEVMAKCIVRHPRLQIREGVDETPGNRLIRIGEIPRADSDRQASQSVFHVVPKDTPSDSPQSGRVFSLQGHAPTMLAAERSGEKKAQTCAYLVVPEDTQVVVVRDQRTQGGMYRRGGYVRVLTAREVARVMGMPEEWSWGDLTQRQAKSLLGNAVIPRMVELVLRGIRPIAYRTPGILDGGARVA